MKGAFIPALFMVGFLTLLIGVRMYAQEGQHLPSAKKENFSSFTRKNIGRGKIWMARNKGYLNHPDAGFIDQYSPNKNAIELFAKRKIDSKFFINKDSPSIFYTQKSSGPMHFRRNQQWITIDPRLSPKGPLLYEASNQEHPLGFDVKKKSSYFITPEGRTYFNNWKLYGEDGGKQTLLAVADWTNYTAGDDGVAIKNIFPGIDAEMKVSRGSIKTNFIIHANKFSTYKKLLFRDSFSAGHPGNLRFSNGLSGNGLVSSAEYRLSARTVFHIKEAVMYQEKNPSSFQQFIPYFLEGNKLTLAIDAEILNAGLMTGDMIIDPMVEDSGILHKDQINGSQFNPDCTFKKSCNFGFDIPSLPSATITDAFFSFGFNANLPCLGQDGAFSFSINTNCSSQMWTGTSILPGPQYFTNQRILMNDGSSIVTCFPKPTKSNCGQSQNIHFTFSFFRTCKGKNGCDGACIGAATDLTITLVGRTFDSASLSASTNNTCPGAPVILTARGFYGIPPYNFIWQGLPQFNGDSSIQVNPTADAVYSVQISDVCSTGNTGTITQSVNLHVLPKPATPVLTSNSPVCAQGQLVLSAPYNPGTKYLIKNPLSGLGGGPFDSTAVFNNVTSAYAGTWIAIATDANGCNSDTGRTNVVINPTLPPPTVSIIASATRICTGGLVSFTASVSNGGASPIYQWLLNGNKVGTNSPVFSGNNFFNNDVVSCVVSNNATCGGGTGTSNSIVLSVSPALSPTFDPIGPLCQNSEAQVLPPTSKEGIAGTWSPATINTSILGTSVYLFTPISASACSIPVALNITIVTSISPTFPAISDSFCVNAIAPSLPATSKEGIHGTWNPSSINTANAGQTTYTFTPASGQCASPATIDILINPLPILTMGPDITIAPGGSAKLDVSVTGNIITYKWKPTTGLDDPNIKDPVASPSSTTVYTLDIVDDNNCEASGSIKVTVSNATSKISVPNAFSPNGDGNNDTWIITNLSSFPGATVDVYNRYGQLVFHSDNNNKAWDGNFNGKPLPLATYYYIIDLKNNEKKIAGSVTIFR